MTKYACMHTAHLREGRCGDCECRELKSFLDLENRTADPVNKFMPACLRNLPVQKSKAASSKRRKESRDLAELTILESIQRLQAERRSTPKDWERGYNSAITTLELFLQEIKAKRWVGTESK